MNRELEGAPVAASIRDACLARAAALADRGVAGGRGAGGGWQFVSGELLASSEPAGRVITEQFCCQRSIIGG